jgi:hypothetical protein
VTIRPREWPPAGFSPSDPIQTHAQLVRLASGLEFHMPGWSVEWREQSLGYGALPSFSLYSDRFDSYLVLTCKTFDTYTYRAGDEQRPEKRITIQHVNRVPEYLRVGDLPEWFRHTVHSALRHEADEWLRVQGWMLWNPHGESKYAPVTPQPPGVTLQAEFGHPIDPPLPFNPF